jgi:hypothetical protein
MAYQNDRRPGYQRDQGRYGRGRNDADRDFFDRAGDEVRSWFGDEEAARRRRRDEAYDERMGYRDQAYADRDRYGDRNDARGSSAGHFDRATSQRTSDDRYGDRRDTFGDDRAGGYDHGWSRSGRGVGGIFGWSRGSTDNDRSDDRRRGRDYGSFPEDHHAGYRSWRDKQLSQFDRDYDEYRREHEQRFASEFGAWREGRRGQRDALAQVREHQEVVGSDGGHVGSVDHVRGDHILLTRSDRDADGHHHSISSRWIATVSEKVTLSMTADEAKRGWQRADSDGSRSSRDTPDQTQHRAGATAKPDSSGSADSISSLQAQHGTDASRAREGASDQHPVQASDPRSATIDRGDVTPASPGAAGDEAAARNSEEGFGNR